MTQDIALEYLTKDSVLNMDMIESIGRNEAKILEASEQGVLLYNNAGEVYMMSADSPEAARQMLSEIKSAEVIVVHQEYSIPLVEESFAFDGITQCHQVVYEPKEPLPEPDRSFEIRTLDESYLSFVCEHYSHGSDEDYLSERLGAGVIKGAFLGDKLAGFIGQHAEGSMGMLEVLPQYRHNHIAVGLETYLINQLLREHHTPYAQVIVGNAASLSLQKKLNLSVSEGLVSWMYQD